MGQETPSCWCCSCTSQGQSRWRSFCQPSSMLGLMVKAVLLCLGLLKIKSVKSNHIQAEKHRRRKTETCGPPCLPQTCPPSTAQVGHQHRLAAILYSKDGGCHPGPPPPPAMWPACNGSYHSVQVCSGQMTEKMWSSLSLMKRWN